MLLYFALFGRPLWWTISLLSSSVLPSLFIASSGNYSTHTIFSNIRTLLDQANRIDQAIDKLGAVAGTRDLKACQVDENVS